ncbi:calcium-dependent protein kinase [Monoraphidium neglectum]|uniref:Calcium-dependent protein kinase n=1 Tax=Monoraphidium neglectum TaxID=145388 RepID=A0A0D2N1K9_9CHLO|nr:calcium-dependent protein kinase [Monoraphidium neglectum]KIZ00131.1 calcium-dependent protein kinase [Monoraphidium neglectum]|eukprot:XP_013899150.1 calcium-dependent protein kinase [Monoraphidium neglectum]
MARIVEAFEDDAHVHVVMDLCSGGGLLQRVVDQGPLSEREAAAVMRSLLEAVAYAHDMGVMHRDIKLDNLMWRDASRDPGHVTLIDWGFSTWVPAPRAARLKGLCGTSFYVAPEVLSGAYDERADVWSCGVVLYVLLCGRPPFGGGRTEAVFRQIRDDGVPAMCGAPWPAVSEGAKDAVRRMMTYFAQRRPTAREMLQHEWIRGGGDGGDGGTNQGVNSADGAPLADVKQEREPELLRRLRAFASLEEPARRAAAAAARGRCPDQTRGLRELFAAMDPGGAGAVGAGALGKALEQRGGRPDPQELRALVAAADLDGDGILSLDEFLAAAAAPSCRRPEPAVHPEPGPAAPAAGKRAPARPPPAAPGAAPGKDSGDATGAADQGGLFDSRSSSPAPSTTCSLPYGPGEAGLAGRSSDGGSSAGAALAADLAGACCQLDGVGTLAAAPRAWGAAP